MSQRWLDYSLELPMNGMVDASRVRARLAAQTETMPEMAFSASIFNYAEDGKSLKTVSPFRFGGGKLFHIYAAGNSAVDTLSAEGHKITRLLSASYDSFLCEQRKTGFFEMSIAPTLARFRIPVLVLQQKPTHHKLLVSMSLDQKSEYAEKLILDGLRHHIRTMDIPFDLDDPEFIFGETAITGDVFPVEVKPGVWFLAAKNVLFRANLNLVGPYHVGHLISRGFGMIVREKVRTHRNANN